MSTIIKATNGKKRRHAATPDGKPLCGGGHGARKAAYQVDLGDDIDCEPCLEILAALAAKKAKEEEYGQFPWTRARRKSWRITRSGQYLVLSYRNRFQNGLTNAAIVLHQCDERLAGLIAQGLNLVYPPPVCKTAGEITDYEI